jgi:hypothetical protein
VRTRRIAWQSAVTGIGLSAVAMVFAALGYLTPVAGAIVQEVIDLAVIANALRALRVPRAARRRSAFALDDLDEPVPGITPSSTCGLEELALVAEQLDELRRP